MPHIIASCQIDFTLSLNIRKIETYITKLDKNKTVMKKTFITYSELNRYNPIANRKKTGILLISRLRCESRSFQVESKWL